MSPRHEPEGEETADVIAGRYRLEREVGRGGMGAVWLGHDEVLGRRVALKRIGLVPGAASTDLERAEREAQVGAHLQHPHLVAVFDLVVDGEDRWLVMEYVEGSTLAVLVRDRGPLGPDDAAALLLPVADALVTAHAAGIVHRDVKPSNILVGLDGSTKLSDFGIARRLDDASLTHTGLMIGSPTYLAPEVASGERGEAPSDVWAFGATLSYALTGRPLYPSEDNVLRTLHHIIHDAPAPVAGAGWLAPVLAGTLEKDPSRRWTMREVREALARTVPGPVPVGSPPRRRLPAEAILLAVVAALVLGVVGYALLAGGGPAPEQRQPAAQPTTQPTTRASASTPSPSPSHRSSPTVAGMKAFIRTYVATVASDPRRAWSMLTPAFQRASGGFEHYQAFWEPAGNGRVLDISADPTRLRVRYHVHFDHFHNGPGPTVLDLSFDHGRYRIAAEHTAGFHPAS